MASSNDFGVFMNAAIDQNVEKIIIEENNLWSKVEEKGQSKI